VTLFVGFAPGGAADAAARLIAKKLTENIGQNVIVENKAGAGGNIVHQQVANGVADGSVILLGSIGPMTIAPHMMKMGFEPFKDLAPISGGVNFPNMLVVNKESGIKNLADFVAMAKKAPDTVSFASTGAGSASHLTGELFAIRTNTEMLHVPYKGGAPAMQDLLANRFTGYFSAPPTSIPHVESGKLVAIATTGLTRPSYLSNVPTVAESGFPGFEALNWYAFLASAKVPSACANSACKVSDFKTAMTSPRRTRWPTLTRISLMMRPLASDPTMASCQAAIEPLAVTCWLMSICFGAMTFTVSVGLVPDTVGFELLSAALAKIEPAISAIPRMIFIENE
jgi:tripartite-type tricarboxylate transporter receptor subunit TctC